MALIPVVIEESPRGERSFDIFSRLLRDRIVMINGQIEPNMANTEYGKYGCGPVIVFGI